MQKLQHLQFDPASSLTTQLQQMQNMEEQLRSKLQQDLNNFEQDAMVHILLPQCIIHVGQKAATAAAEIRLKQTIDALEQVHAKVYMWPH